MNFSSVIEIVQLSSFPEPQGNYAETLAEMIIY